MFDDELVGIWVEQIVSHRLNMRIFLGIRIWATPSRGLVFWDGAPSPSIGIRAIPQT